MVYKILILLCTVINLTKCEFNIKPEDVRSLEKRLVADENAVYSPECQMFMDNASLLQWLVLLDVSAHIPLTGLQEGNLYNLGSFDGCLNIKDSIPDGPTYEGLYCFASYFFINSSQNNEATRTMGHSMDTIGFHFAQCLPNLCTVQDFKLRYPLMEFEEANCYSKATEPKISDNSGTIFTISFLAVFGAFVVLSTIYDLILHHFKRKSAHPLLTAFSAITNGKRIFLTPKKSDQLLCLNGIRAISMAWIIIYHEYQDTMLTAVNNYVDVGKFIKGAENLYILQGTVAVDSFFAVGGLILVYTFMKSGEKGIGYIPMSYVHRYFRLTPVLAVMILIHLYLLNYLGNGPLWRNIRETLVVDCEEHWWSALLYVQNFVNAQYNCVPQSWYLSVDMQLFILSPIILFPLQKWPKHTIVGMVLIIIGGIVEPLTLSYINEFPISGTVISDKSYDYMELMYFKTYSRFGPYVIGMLTGYFIYKVKNEKIKLNLNSGMVLGIWAVTLATFGLCLYGAGWTLGDETRTINNAIFNGTFRSAWAIAICSLSFMCITGFGGPINTILSLNIFQVIGKLSYCMYIVHYSVIILRLSALRTQTHFSHFYILFNFWGDFMITLVISFFYSLMFEFPFVVIEKYFIMFLKFLIKPCTKKLFGK